MSFAVNERSGPGEKLQRAIEDARNKVSIFAAAGNCRTWENESVAYPARSTDVIRIYSFKGSGASSDFNPEKEPQTKQYLGCIGENLTDPTTKHIASPGTSIATAIAAGIGAIVLDFARFDDEESPDRDWLKDGNTLKQKRVMEHILWNMTQQVPYSHNIIKPQRLFDVTKRGWIKKARTQIGNILDKERTGCL
jgi:hypothetical protein